ncbi:Uncharacterised protein [Klebsiella pneumoniae]|nr:Uncharacterised protein [Klebsiella pneumoniae]
MAAQRGYQMGRWLAGRLMKELGLVSCQQPTHRYKRGGHEHVAIPNHLERQFAVNGAWICPYISRHLLSLNPLLACCRRYSRGKR